VLDHQSKKLGLRERKREASRRKILSAAASVFRQKGYDSARIEEIARRAVVSPGTVYNYFPTKDGLLLALVSSYREAANKACQHIVRDPPSDALEALMAFHGSLLDQGLKFLDRTVWRYVYSASIIGAWHSPEDDHWHRERTLVADQIALLRALKDRGVLRSDFPEREWAEVVHSIVYFQWQTFMADEEMTPAQLKSIIRRQFRIVIALWQPPAVKRPSR
jgi:AcrR family transcriptional regulator